MSSIDKKTFLIIFHKTHTNTWHKN